MAIKTSIPCPKCSEALWYEHERVAFECRHCGYCSVNDGTQNPVGTQMALYHANALREYDLNFEEALRECEQLIDDHPDCEEGYWFAWLAKAKVLFVGNTPTFFEADPNLPPVEQDSWFAQMTPAHQQQAREIDKQRRKAVEYAQRRKRKINGGREHPYEVFFSLRLQTNSGKNTSESKLAERAKKALEQEGYHNIFFSPDSLGRDNDGWEAHICAALREAQCLILIADSAENVTTPWVQSEWKRFYAMEKPIIVIGAVDPKTLPKELRGLQVINSASETCMNLLIRRVRDAVVGERQGRDVHQRAKLKRGVKRAVLSGVLVLGIAAVIAGGILGNLAANPVTYSNEDGQITLSGSNFFFNDEELVLDKHNDVGVIGIGDRAFAGNGTLKTVKLGPTVATVGEGAFANNTSLSRVEFYSSEISIGEGAFEGCTSLQSISFKECTALSLAEDAFRNCSSLESITLEGVTSIGTNAFRGCSALKKVFIDVGSGEFSLGMGAFDGVSSQIEIAVPTVSEKLYSDLKKEYSQMNIVTYTRDKAEEAEYFIGKIGLVTPDSLPAIEKAETLCEALSSEEREKVSNYADLAAARKAYNVVMEIKGLGTVTLESENDIAAAERSYAALSETAKKKVSNYGTLTDARAVYNTMKAIALIGEVDLQSGSAIEHAETMYSELTPSQKEQVTNYSDLKGARGSYSVCVAIQAIQDIGTVSENSGSDIERAQSTYDALSPALRSRVTNGEALKEAQSVFSVILVIGQIDALITAQSVTSIIEAEAAYTSLTADLQGKVVNATLLEQAKTILRVVTGIADIGTVGLSSGAKIESAEELFGALTDLQKARVGNSGDLTDARAVYNVMVKIDEIGKVTLSSESAIAEAEEAYLGLSAALQERITNFSSIKTSRSILLLLENVQNLGAFALGSDSNLVVYDVDSSDMSSIEAAVNNEGERAKITNLTFTTVKTIEEDIWKAVFPSLSKVRYDFSSEAAPAFFTVPSSTEFTYVLVGSTAQTYQTKIKDDGGEEAHLELYNFSIEGGEEGKEGEDLIDWSGVLHGYLSFTGTVSITAKGTGQKAVHALGLTIKGVSGAALTICGGSGGNGIKATDLVIEGAGNITVSGGDGIDAGDGGNGTAGGIAIVAGTLAVKTAGTLSIYGGTGGEAYDRPSGDNGGEGSDGKDGYRGGDGGVALSVSGNITMISGTVSAHGGDAGRGGHASECNRSEVTGKGSKNVVGGRGGDGGNGGTAIVAQKIEMTGGSLSAAGGNGGNSGKRGGCHDGDYSDFVLFEGKTTAKDGEAGTPGSGGAGLSSGCIVEGVAASSLTQKNGNKGEQDLSSPNQC